MNRNKTKLIALFSIMGALLLGAGVTLAPREAVKTEAATKSLSIGTSHFNGTSYGANNNEKTATVDGVDYKWESNQIMLQSNAMQWQKTNGAIWNNTSLGTKISSIEITASDNNLTVYFGGAKKPTSGSVAASGTSPYTYTPSGDYSYFQIKTGNLSKTTVVKINFETSSAPVSVIGVSLPIEETILEGGTVKLTPVFNPTNATNKDGVWSSTNISVATVDQEGLVTGVGVGSSTISFTTDDGGKVANTLVHVNEAPKATVFNFLNNDQKISSSVEGAHFQSGQFDVNITKVGGTNYADYNPIRVYASHIFKVSSSENVTRIHKLVFEANSATYANAIVNSVWSESNITKTATEKIAEIVYGEHFETIQFPASAQTRIEKLTIYYEDAGEVFPTGVEIVPPESNQLTVGTAVQLFANVTPSDTTETDVRWESSNDAIAIISQNGTITPLMNGSVKFSVYSTYDENLADSINMTVSGQTMLISDVLSVSKFGLTQTYKNNFYGSGFVYKLTGIMESNSSDYSGAMQFGTSATAGKADLSNFTPYHDNIRKIVFTKSGVASANVDAELHVGTAAESKGALVAPNINNDQMIVYEVTGNYKYFRYQVTGLASQNYFDSVTILTDQQIANDLYNEAKGFADFVMDLTDAGHVTTPDCEDNFMEAWLEWDELSSGAKALFKTHEDFAEARQRFTHWAKVNGFDSLDDLDSGAKVTLNVSSSNSIYIIVIVSILGISTLAGYYFIRKRPKEEIN